MEGAISIDPMRIGYAWEGSIGHASTTDRERFCFFWKWNTTRQLTKVKAGTMDTDAINVKQLKDHTALETGK